MRKDLLTGEEFVPKRINQKFANAANRIRYNNNRANEVRRNKEFVNKHLHSNHRILVEIMGREKEKIFHKEFLNGKGMHFGVLTHYERVEGKSVMAIYQFLIHPDGKEHVRITNNQMP